jgi:hypothetical protein
MRSLASGARLLPRQKKLARQRLKGTGRTCADSGRNESKRRNAPRELEVMGITRDRNPCEPRKPKIAKGLARNRLVVTAIIGRPDLSGIWKAEEKLGPNERIPLAIATGARLPRLPPAVDQQARLSTTRRMVVVVARSPKMIRLVSALIGPERQVRIERMLLRRRGICSRRSCRYGDALGEPFERREDGLYVSQRG